jgi:hypothetical protein
MLFKSPGIITAYIAQIDFFEVHLSAEGPLEGRFYSINRKDLNLKLMKV